MDRVLGEQSILSEGQDNSEAFIVACLGLRPADRRWRPWSRPRRYPESTDFPLVDLTCL